MGIENDLMEIFTPGRLAWRRAVEDPALNDLPYKVETNEYGQLIMSPVKLVHGIRQAEIAALLREHACQAGRVAVEIGIDTSKGVKAPDVVWMSIERWSELSRDAEALTRAPEICIEVLSDSNTGAQMDEKRALYFESGALEFWTCELDGRMRFFSAAEELSASKLAPEFPHTID